MDRVFARIHQAKAYVFTSFLVVWEESRCGIFEGKCEGQVKIENRREGTIKQHVSSTLNDFGQDCVPETQLHRTIFVAQFSIRVHSNSRNDHVAIHLNVSTEVVSMIRKLIELVDHLCILIAIMKYMHDMLRKIHIESTESNAAQLKRTLLEPESCAFQGATDPLAEGNV